MMRPATLRRAGRRTALAAGGRMLVAVVAAGLLLGACSASKGGTARPQADGSPAGAADAGGSCGKPQQSIKIAAEKSVFDKKCLAAKAGQPITLQFNNADNFGHNFAILDRKGGTQKLFTGEVVTGPATTVYQVPALPAGTYYFQCNIHPFIMQGSYTVS